MKHWRLEDWYASLLLVILGGIVIHAPLSVFFGVALPDHALLIKAWKEILMFIALILAIVLVSRQGKWSKLYRDKLAWMISAYLAIHLLSLLMWNGTNAVLAGLGIDLRYIAYFALVYVLLWLYPRFLPLFKKVAIAGAILVIGFGTLQIILPADSLKYLGYGPETIQPYLTIDRNDDFVRLQSTLRGPNPYGAYAAAVAVIAFAWLATRKNSFDWRVATIAGLAVLGTYLSYARSAYVALAVGAAIVFVVRFGRVVQLKHWLALGVASLAVIVAGAFAWNTDFVSNVVLHEDPEEGGQVNSNDGHWASLVHGVEAMARQPFGAGIGSTGSASLLSDRAQIIENQYLLIAHEVGWLGLALFIAIFVVVMLRLWGLRQHSWALGIFASGVGLAFIGILLPVWVDDTVSIVWWGLAAGALAVHQKSPRVRAKFYVDLKQ